MDTMVYMVKWYDPEITDCEAVFTDLAKAEYYVRDKIYFLRGIRYYSVNDVRDDNKRRHVTYYYGEGSGRAMVNIDEADFYGDD